MAASYQQDKTEAATPRRREQAKQKGQVAKSRELVSTALFLGILVFLSIAGSTLFQQALTLTRDMLANLDSVELSAPSLSYYFTTLLGRAFAMLLPLLITLFSVALVTNLLQTGFIFSPNSLQPKLSRLSPLQGLKRVFSMQALNELFKSLLKIGAVGAILYFTITTEAPSILALSDQTVIDVATYMGTGLRRIGLHASYAMIFMAMLDYVFQRWQHEKSLRMSRQEVKDEKKEQDGDPQIKLRIRNLMRDMARNRMMGDVPAADVIITNPTHIAVALQYRRDEMAAPKVIAKGAGYIAERIKSVATEHRIPIVENKPLAQNLFKTVEIGAFIPETLYQAVAEILAYVYQIRPPSTT